MDNVFIPNPSHTYTKGEQWREGGRGVGTVEGDTRKGREGEVGIKGPTQRGHADEGRWTGRLS